MGLLNNTVQAGFEKVGLGGVFKRETNRPSYVGGDFPEGMTIVEIVNNKPQEADRVVLKGTFAPFQPFEYGGEQRLAKDYYPGNSEPTVHILGPKEKNTRIRGRLKSKFFKDEDLREAAVEFQKLIDAMRIRGNLVRITLGEWRRYGFIENVDFKMRTLADIDYEIDFFIVGFNPPSNCKFVNRADDDVIAPNRELTNKALENLDAARGFPAEMPRTLGEFLEDQINVVAGAIATVTSYVDGVIQDVEDINRAANRAVGLIRYARATVSRTIRRIGAIETSVQNLGSAFSSGPARTRATIINSRHINNTKAGLSSLQSLLAGLQARFAGLAATIPLVRHLVQEGDTLQSLSIKYYNTAEQWNRIYRHNKLQSTELERGTVLEIPRL